MLPHEDFVKIDARRSLSLLRHFLGPKSDYVLGKQNFNSCYTICPSLYTMKKKPLKDENNSTITWSHLQDAGLLLRKPWLRESDTKGKAVAFIMIGMALSQLILGSSLGFIISALGSTRVVLAVALIGECFAAISALFLTTKPASHDCQWCSLKPLVKCFRRLIHRGGLDVESQV